MAGRIAQLSLFVVAGLIGVLLVGQLRSQARPIELSNLSPQELSGLVETLQQRNVELTNALAELREQVRDYERAEVQGQSTLELTSEELTRVRAFAGLEPVVGQGIAIRMTGPFDPTAVNDLVHELRNAGAEAIAIDGIRITGRSVAVLGTSAIEIDGRPLDETVEVLAVGYPTGLQSSIERPGGLKTYLEQSLDVTMSIETRRNLRLPATERDLAPTVAEPVE
ncbi:MAG TPA: DUF881 domain-containing protein [Candidatus Limnocylindria bacterium]|nr:DUF881 domain-containing protein [Candidatus Limnocylindria bacterium]